jgi:hypothetical protein
MALPPRLPRVAAT